MRRLAFLAVGGVVWVLLGAVPASADNGPHMSTVGQLTDRCAGCHRLHSAQAAYVLVEEEPALCYTCHGAGGTGASTDVQEGLGFTQISDANETTVRIGTPGGLRGGGFEYALIDAGAPTFDPTTGRVTNVGVKPAANWEPTTSAHSVDESPQTAWGAGPFSASKNVGTSGVKLTCTTCHDPHGGSDGGTPTYRILNPNPAGAPVSGGTAASNTLAVVCIPGTSDPAGPNNPCTRVEGANTVTCSADRSIRVTSSGATTYRVRVTCKSSIYPTTVGGTINGTSTDYPPDSDIASNMPAAPNIQAVNDVATKTYTTTDYWRGIAQAPAGAFTTASFTGEMANWCAQCHTRYKATSGQTYAFDTGDAVFKYRHQGASESSWTATGGSARPNCIQCHVAHGSNSATGDKSSALENPGGGRAGLGVGTSPASADNRLLRIDQRGTCAACHPK